MAEAEKRYRNIEEIDVLLGEKGVAALLKNVQSTEKKVGEILKKLSEFEAEAKQRAAEESARAEREAEEALRAQQPEPAEKPAATAAEEPAEKPAAPKAEEGAKKTAPAEPAPDAPVQEKEKPAEKPVKPAAKKEKSEQPAAETKPAEEKTAAPAAEKTAEQPVKKPAEEQAPKAAEKPAAKPADAGNGSEKTEKPAESAAEKPADKAAAKPAGTANVVEKKNGTTIISTKYADPKMREQMRATFINTDRRRGDRNAAGQRPAAGGTAKSQNAQASAQPQRPARPPYAGQRPAGANRPAAPGGKFAAAQAMPAPAKTFTTPAKKKASYEKPYVEKQRTMNKRALVKQQVSVSDFDEDKSGYRKLRVKKQKQQTVQTIKIDHAVVTTENIPLKVLSEKLGITAVEITKRLFKEGIAKTINDSIDYDTAAYIASDLGIDLEYKPEKTAEEALDEIYNAETAGDEGAVTRPPVVTVMGHVDHGKTSLLDKIRSTNVTAGEAGGITQHIGAYSVTVKGKTITFLDTPGHEAFTAMRARGASVTDIVILVVAADDGIMPQTVEAINHAKAADVPIIVAVNKMDKPEANLDRVKQGLTSNGLVPEEWGGDAIVVPVSAKTGAGIEDLLDAVNLVAEVKELKANPNNMARGVIIEAKLDKGKGPMASVLIQNGTLHTGDNVISGTTTGRVRAMLDDKGRLVKAAGPSMAVSILGLEDVPNAGDSIIAVEQDKLMKQVLDERKRKESESMVKSQTRVTLDDVFGKIAEGKIKGLNIIVKGDVQGSVEAVKQSLLKLSGDEVRVNVLHSGAGAINESDVMLADSSNAIIVGFNVRPDTKAKALAEKSHVDVRTYRIIYELLDDIQAALKGMLAPKYREIMTGKCDVLQTFRITGVGMVAGCYVTEGKIVRGGKLRIYRDDVMVVEGAVRQLKRFKDDVKEVSGGFECGVSIEGFDGIQIGDVIECYITEEIPA